MILRIYYLLYILTCRILKLRKRYFSSIDAIVQSESESSAIRAKTYRRYERTDAGLVLDDFNQILEAIALFRVAYGDLDIPVKFEVPAQEPPWPSSLHGLRLGKRLEKLFTSNEFFDHHPEKVN